MKILIFFTIVGLFGLLILYTLYRFDCTRSRKRAERREKPWTPKYLRILYAVLGVLGTAFYGYTVYCMIDYVAVGQYRACNENARNLAVCAEDYRAYCEKEGLEIPGNLSGRCTMDDALRLEESSFAAYLTENFTDWYHACSFDYVIVWDADGKVAYALYSHGYITPPELYQYKMATRSEQHKMYLFHPDETVGCYPLKEE